MFINKEQDDDNWHIFYTTFTLKTWNVKRLLKKYIKIRS